MVDHASIITQGHVREHGARGDSQGCTGHLGGTSSTELQPIGRCSRVVTGALVIAVMLGAAVATTARGRGGDSEATTWRECGRASWRNAAPIAA